LGIPVRVHPFFWAAVVLLGLRGNQKPLHMLLWVGACFVSILIHELGHALAARAHGWQPWITLHGFGGLASYRPTYHSAASQLLITFAGPGAGFVFAALIVACIAISGHDVRFDPSFDFGLPLTWTSFRGNAQRLIEDLLYINIFWGLVNLLPVYPLDGGQIARTLLELLNPHDGVRQSLWLSLITAAGLAILALARLGDQFLAIFFGYLAYVSYATLQGEFGPRGGLGGFR
jgi:membrane-associated protease RseP (regulator of RpoE activity)